MIKRRIRTEKVALNVFLTLGIMTRLLKTRLMNMQVKTVLMLCLACIVGIVLVYEWIPMWKMDTHNDGVMARNVSSVTPEPEITDYNLHWRHKDGVFVKRVKGTVEQKHAHDDVVSSLDVDTMDCNGRKSGGARGEAFTEIGPEVFVYSVFFDDRPRQRFIRMIATYKYGKDRDSLNRFYCLFENDVSYNSTSYISTNISFYEMCENHRKPFGGWILSCPVPQELKSIPLFIRVYQGGLKVNGLAPSIKLCVKSYAKNVETRKLNFGVCVPPIFGDVRPKDVIEFIELNRLLGAEKILIYYEVSDHSVSSSVLRVLRYYQSMNVVHLMTWGLPFDDKNVWYHGQSLAINDCLYRHMNDFHHLAFIDLDEIIVPKGGSQTWNDVMANLKTTYGKKFTDASAFSFKTAFFSPEFSRHVYSNELGTVVRTNRTLHFSYRRHKLIVRPERIFELGIHHVSRAWPDDIQHENLVVPKEIAFIHHYRACVQEFGIHCNMRLQDFGVANLHGTQLNYNVLKIMSSIPNK